MANVLNELFKNIADSIRAKTGDVATMKPAEFPEKISTIETQPETEEKTVDITENGPVEVIPEEGKLLTKVTANVNVPIPEGYIKPEGEVEITENGPMDVTDKASVNVNVPIPEGYIKPEGEVEITENGPVDVTRYASAVVNVPSSGDGSGFYLTEENESGGVTYHFTAEESGGGGAEFNIAYGDTEPEDTSKLWVKTTEPSVVKVDSEIEKVPSDECSATIIDSKNKPRQSIGAQVGTKVYFFSGYHNGYTRSIFSYDLETHTLVELGVQVPQNISHSATSAVGTKIYIFGGSYGSDYYDKIYCFDTVTETISTLEATLPTKTDHSASVSVGSKIYIFGGHNDSGMTNQIECFDSENLTILQLNTVLPTALEDIRCVAYENNIYLFGGHDESGTHTDKILKFNCETEIITTCAAKLPQGLSGSCCVLMDDTILILGGYWSNSIYLFDCNSETITTLSVTLPERKYYASVGVLDNSILLIGGLDGYSNSHKTILFAFGMSVILSADTLQIQSTLDKNLFNLINTDTMKAEIGVKSVLKGNADGIGEPVEAALHNGTSWVTI